MRAMQQNNGGALFLETTIIALKEFGFETCITARDKRSWYTSWKIRHKVTTG